MEYQHHQVGAAAANSQHAQKLWAMRDAGIRRLQTAPTETTTWSEGSEGTGGGSEAKPWKVKIARGGYLDSASDGSRSDGIHASNQHRVLRRLKLIDSDESSVATTKVTSFTFQNKIQTRPSNARSLSASSASAYYRPVDALAKEDGPKRSSPPRPPRKKVESPASNDRHRSRRDEAPTSWRVDEIAPTPSDLSVTLDAPSGLSSFSWQSSQFGGASDHMMGASRRDEMQRQGGVRRLSVDKSDSDDDSVKQMEFMTHTFQRHDNGANGRYKSKPGPLCFGVDVKSPLEEEAATPRNASCSFSSVVGEILGVTPPRSGNTPTRTSLSPLVDVMKSIICSPDRMPNTGSAKKMTKRRSQKANDDDDDWSVGVDFQSEYSYDRSEGLSMPPKAKQYNKPPRTPPRRADRNRPQSGVEALQDKYDQSLTYRQFHREDLSYYGTEITSVYHPPTKYSCDEDDDRSDTVSRSFGRSPRPFRQRPSYRKSPFVRRRDIGF